jgi:glycoside/pentoside/hexuronide:cation symporter, GPH family
MVESTASPDAPAPASAQAWATHQPLGFRARTLFATGDMVDGIVAFGSVTFVFYYLTAVVGLSGTLAGGLLAAATVLDAFADPLVGSLSDNTRSRWGRRLPYMLASAVPVGLLFALQFSVPDLKPGWLLAVYLGLVLFFLRISISFFGLPYAALGAELCTDYNERSVLFAYRWFFNCFGNLILLTLGYWVFLKGPEGLLDRQAYVYFGWTCGAVAVAAALTSALSARSQLGRLRTVYQPSFAGPFRLFRELREVFSNRSFWVLFISVLLFWTSAGVATTLGLHANLYFWRLPSEVIGTLPLINLAGWGIGIPLATVSLTRLEKRDVAGVGLGLAAFSLFIMPPLKLAGLLPEGEALYLILAVVSFLGGLAGTFALVSWGSMMADAADEHEYLFGSRREGLYFAGITLSFKSAAGLGGLVAGVALDAIGFPRDIASVGIEAIRPETVRNLGIVQGPLAALLGVVGAVILVGYRLDRKEVARIQGEIASRQAARV